MQRGQLLDIVFLEFMAKGFHGISKIFLKTDIGPTIATKLTTTALDVTEYKLVTQKKTKLLIPIGYRTGIVQTLRPNVAKILRIYCVDGTISLDSEKT